VARQEALQALPHSGFVVYDENSVTVLHRMPTLLRVTTGE